LLIPLIAAFQANIFDGKSDGKNPSGSLLPAFIVSNIPGGVKLYK
jgi:hypothetical protein